MDAITVFVKVVEAGNFSAAARRLGMPKTTVSAKVAGLEKRLGPAQHPQAADDRSGRRLFPTLCNRIREVEQGEAALQVSKTKPSGILKVTAPVDVGHAILPRIARAYAAKCPDVSLQFILTNRIVDIVEEGVDLAIRFAGALKDSSLIARRFIEIRSDLWASPQYMKRLGKLSHPRDLVDAAFIKYLFQKTSVTLTNGKSDFEVEMKGRFQVDDAELCKSLTVSREGMAWLPDYLTADAVKAGKLVRVLSEWRTKQQRPATLYFVYAGRQYALPKVESFIQTAFEQVQLGK
ncbi:LysR substrate-binding domain-containing protein [Bradyrhizobium sp. USDA 4486]